MQMPRTVSNTRRSSVLSMRPSVILVESRLRRSVNISRNNRSPELVVKSMGLADVVLVVAYVADVLDDGLVEAVLVVVVP